MTPTRVLPTVLAAASLASCSLVRLPLRVAGGVIEGTAEVAGAAVSKPMEAHRKRKARKEREKAEKEQQEATAAQGLPTDPLGDPSPVESISADDPIPSDAELDLPPLPEEYADPPP